MEASEAREWICRAKWDAKELPKELQDIIYREIGWLEWQFKT